MSNDQLRTPPEIYAYLNHLYGPFDIDLCASKDNALHENYMTKAIDAWSQDWSKIQSEGHAPRIFCHPPKSVPNLRAFTERAAQFSWSTPYSVVVGFMPARLADYFFKDNVINKASELIFLTGNPFVNSENDLEAYCIVVWSHNHVALSDHIPKVRWFDYLEMVNRGAMYLERYQDVWRTGPAIKSYLKQSAA